jgi:hypothetical protein
MGQTGAERRRRSTAIVMSGPLRQQATQMAFVERNDPIEAFTPRSADHSFAIGVRCGAITGVFSTWSPMECNAPSTAREWMPSRSCTRKLRTNLLHVWARNPN